MLSPYLRLGLNGTDCTAIGPVLLRSGLGAAVDTQLTKARSRLYEHTTIQTLISPIQIGMGTGRLGLVAVVMDGKVTTYGSHISSIITTA